MKKELNEREIENYVDTYMSVNADNIIDNVYSIVEELVKYINSADEDHMNDFIYECIDESFIYYCDQWALIMTYCEPHNADLNDAINYLASDIYNILEEIKNDIEDEEEE